MIFWDIQIIGGLGPHGRLPRCGKQSACQSRRRERKQVPSLGGEDPLEEGMTTHSSIPVWRISWTEEPGGIQSMGSQRIGHDRSELACTHTGPHGMMP